LLGLLAGLTAGSKYIGVLIVPFAVVAILLVPTPGPERRLMRAATRNNYFAPKDPTPESMAGYYRGLNALPHLEVSSGRPTMGYFNPALRVVALDGSVERLKTLAEQIRAAAPTFTVRLIEQANTK
jgi:hypothetical protein